MPRTSPASWPEGTPFTAALSSVVPDRLLRYRVPGAVIAVVERGALASVQPFGDAVKETRAPMTSATVFQVASISKSLAAWGALRLVERGVLDLDAPVEGSLTRWRWPASTFDSRGVTLRRLLSHTAGFSVHGYPGRHPDARLPTLEESLGGDNGAGPVLLIREPGAGFLYSGGGFTVAQLLVEEVAREPFHTFLAREVLAPLGLASSAFHWRDDLRPATAGAYDEGERRVPNYLFTEQAAAGLYATAPDLARFVAALLEGPAREPVGRGVLSPETATLARSPAPATNGGYGLGVETWPLSGQESAVGHGGANVGWRAQWAALPARGAGLVVLTNSDNGAQLTAEVSCRWMQQTAGAVPAWCR